MGSLCEMLLRELAFLGEGEARHTAFILAEDLFGIHRTQWNNRKNERLNQSDLVKAWKAILRLRKNEPVQYITGHTEWLGLTLDVNPSVLIPRPETEEMVHKAIERLGKSFSGTILDIGTGSGCIPIALKKHLPLARVFSIDISTAALKTALHNAEQNSVEIGLIPVDFLDESQWKNLPAADVLISNPPYITPAESAGMLPNVLEYEPHQALFTPREEPLIFYQKIRKHIELKLPVIQYSILEINDQFSEECLNLFQWKEVYHTRLLNDLSGKPRFIEISALPL